MDDAVLLRRYLTERSEASFAEIVRRHLNVVYFTALRHLPADAAHLAEDVSQAVFAQLAAKAAALASRPSITGWLYLAARYEARHAARSEARRKRRETEAEFMKEHPTGEPIAWADLQPVIDDALCGLNDREREVILLRFFEGGAFVDIGARLGVSADAARFRVDRALEKLRVRLAKRGIQSSVALLSTALAGQAHGAAPAGLVSAIAGAPFVNATTPAWLGAVHFMTTTKAITGLAILVGLIGVGMFTRQEQQLDRGAERIAELNARIAPLRARRATLEGRVRAAARAAPSAPEVGASRQVDASTATEAANGTSGQRADRTAVAPTPPPINEELSANPFVRKNLTQWIAGNQGIALAGFYREFNFTPERAEALETLMSQAYINMGVWISLLPEGATMQDMRQRIVQFVGEGAAEKLGEYQRTGFVRRVANALAGNLYDTASPLSATQADALTEMLAGTAPRQGGWPFPSAVDWNAAMAAAPRILTPSQLTVFRETALLLSTQPDLWAGLHTIHPGSLGAFAQPPASIFAPAPATKP